MIPVSSTERLVRSLPTLDRPFALPAGAQDAYRRDGHVFLPGVLTAAEVAAIRPHVAEAVRQNTAELAPEERALGGSSSRIAFLISEAPPALRPLLLSRRLGRIAAELLGVRAVRVLHYYGFWKAPGGAETPWHQDGLFLPLDRDVVTLWLPLVDVSSETAMKFANGSQGAGFVELGHGGDGGPGDPVRSDMEQLGYPIDEGRALRAGDADYHSGRVVHCAPPNRMAYTREVIAICYYPADSRLAPADEVLGFPGGGAGAYYREALRAHYFPGAGDHDVAAGPANPVVYAAAPEPVAALAGGEAPFASPHALPAGAVEGFRARGHTLVRGVMTGAEVRAYAPRLRGAVERHDEERHEMERSVAGREQGWQFVNNLWRLDPAARELVLGRRFGGIAADLLGVDRVRVFRDQSYFKQPGGGNTAWHQDAYFMPLDTEAVVTMWLALAPVTPHMAPMLFADGSHRSGYVGTSLPDDDSMDRFERSLLERGYPVTCYGPLDAGDASFHAGWTLHASRSNTDPRRREAIVVVFFADGARVAAPGIAPGAAPQEVFAATIRENNRRESLPGLAPGDLAAGERTPLIFDRRGRGGARGAS
ncbi:phytanoyl-CoA dioxygenase family protein [Sorangium sp. So ce1335]|uniref:phytanoyl-CoA dioxygenase family protein n=1 Tax=Sorangium sp. So ce1335 TaxID=3133335 RepID=UPI003F60F60C